jgi:lipopolysaccharide transport system ATP-binding protein
MTDVAVSFSGIGKRYRVSHVRQSYGRLSESLTGAARGTLLRLRGGPPESVELFWALRDVTFDVRRGEVTGIVGRNGAGKTTLLKILSRITEPTTGRVALRGSVASLLEVGTGFHPELTGRENVYLSGAILGMRRSDIQRRFDEIVDFADVEQFLDTPVKRYSSGMLVRLGFAVAAHLEPDILVVDEVLAVGDAAFQRKCISKMEDVSHEGRTVLFVSHNMPAVESLCTTSVLLERGTVSLFTPTVLRSAGRPRSATAPTGKEADDSESLVSRAPSRPAARPSCISTTRVMRSCATSMCRSGCSVMWDRASRASPRSRLGPASHRLRQPEP